jgi:predicted regulator of Ras-like GTPase activity (Roadblock/LC7/MglB family)
MGATSASKIGGVIEVADDLDGDGYNELLIYSQEGRVYLFDGNNLGGSISTGAYDAYFSANTSTFGSEIEVVDVDDDGHLDLIIGRAGSEGMASLFLNSGSGFSGQIPQSLADATLVGDDTEDRFSSTIAAVDLDGDGNEDLLFGSPGSSYIDSKSGAVITMSASTFLSANGDIASDLGAIYLGEAATDRAGTSLIAGEDWWATGTSISTGYGAVYLFVLD